MLLNKMNSFSNKINYLAYIILAIFSFYINYFFANIGIYPIDSFSFFDSGYLITQGYHPIKDFWVISGIFIDYLQSIFFLIFGNNWNAYIFHSSFLNVLITLFFFFFLNNFVKSYFFNFVLSVSVATLCYPVAGTPFPYQHSYIISLASIMVFYLAVSKEKKIYWFILPFLMLFSFLSMQLPSGLVNFFILIFSLIYFLYFKIKFFIPFFIGSLVCLLTIIFYLIILNINAQDFVIQILLFPLTIGEGRILGDENSYESANLLKRLTLRGTIGHFKFILIFIIANFIVTIFCIKKKIDLSREQILLNLFIIFCAVSFIFHQLITANQTFIFSLVPILCGLFFIQIKEIFRHNNQKVSIFLIALIVFVTIKYHFDYNLNRKFMDLQNVNLSKSIKANSINSKFDKLKWITPHYYSNNPEKEVDLLKDAIDIISNENLSKIAIITHYQFFSVLSEKKINILNRWYFPDNNTHPSSKDNKYYEAYTKRINNFINKKKIEKIYLVKSHPNEFKFINFADLLVGKCFKDQKKNEILQLIIINKC